MYDKMFGGLKGTGGIAKAVSGWIKPESGEGPASSVAGVGAGAASASASSPASTGLEFLSFLLGNNTATASGTPTASTSSSINHCTIQQNDPATSSLLLLSNTSNDKAADEEKRLLEHAISEAKFLKTGSFSLGSSSILLQEQKEEASTVPSLPQKGLVKKTKSGSSTSSSSSHAPRRWTKEEDDRLRKAVEQYGDRRWKEIASVVGTRDNVQCLQRWRKSLRPGLVKGSWRSEEDDILREKYKEKEKDSSLTWSWVSGFIPGRNAKQCRERWQNFLDTTIKRGGWSEEEDATLCKLYEELNGRWAMIARQMPGRTENSVKVRYHSMKRTREKEAKRTKNSSSSSSKTKASKKATTKNPINCKEEGHQEDVNQSVSPTSVMGTSLKMEQQPTMVLDHEYEQQQEGQLYDYEMMQVKWVPLKDGERAKSLAKKRKCDSTSGYECGPTDQKRKAMGDFIPQLSRSFSAPSVVSYHQHHHVNESPINGAPSLASFPSDSFPSSPFESVSRLLNPNNHNERSKMQLNRKETKNPTAAESMMHVHNVVPLLQQHFKNDS